MCIIKWEVLDFHTSYVFSNEAMIPKDIEIDTVVFRIRCAFFYNKFATNYNQYIKMFETYYI